MAIIFLKKRFTIIVFILLLSFYAINNYIWLNLNEFPPFAGEAYHLLKGLDCLHILTQHPKHIFSALIKTNDLRPPLFPVSVALLNTIWDNPRLASAIANIFFSGVLFLSTYYMGKKMQDRKTGLLAAFILAMYPFVFGLSRLSRSNIASMALVSLSLCCILYSEKFKLTLPSILSGVSLGLGILANRTFIFFVIGPIITAVVIALASKQLVSIRKKIISNLISAVIIAIFIGGVWYFPRLSFLLNDYLNVGYLNEYPPIVAPRLFSFASFIFYFRGLVNGQASPFLILFFFIGLIVLLKKGGVGFLLSSWIIVSYAIFTLIEYKEFRETSEYLPAFALITSLGILQLKKQRLRQWLVSAIIIGGLFQYFIVSYTNPSSTGIRLSFFKGKLAEGLTVSSYLYPLNEVFFHYPRRGDWKISKIISAIEKESPGANNDITIGSTDAYIEVKTDWFDPFKLDTWHENFVATNPEALNYFLRTNGLHYNVIRLSYWKEDWRRKPLLDFIVSIKKIQELAPALSQQYKVILQTEAPDRSPLYVYKRLFSRPVNPLTTKASHL